MRATDAVLQKCFRKVRYTEQREMENEKIRKKSKVREREGEREISKRESNGEAVARFFRAHVAWARGRFRSDL